ncbi:AFG1-like ATPase [Metschnikowia bicuspidata]|uniref:AFG1-like ATPase n=1 Tax=Metschnikowia bicuspidata TaxID=27322 RepID=A0A4P9ZCV5_9ASCO|nr:AFG1-like ATPase [Metschnikowia bicuspidata]
MHASAWEANPVELYDERVSQGRLQNDPYQRKILQNISQLHRSLCAYNPPTVVTPDVDLLKPGQGLEMLISGLLGLWGSRTSAKGHENVVKGIYLWGDVGCGKTMLMDLFYLTIPPHLPKRRMHFHQFMQNLHKRSHQLKSEHHADLDVIPLLASEIAQTSTVLCFDEFQVTDVADAMLLRRLLTLLLSPEYGVVLFATSNRAPDDLYLNGIQRVSFIPCIQLIKNQTRVIYSNSPTDYRKVPRPLLSVYYSPKPGVKYHSKTNLAACRKHVQTWTEYFNQGPHARPLIENDVLTVWGRELVVPKSNRPLVAQFSFEQLCGSNMSAGDYLTLTNSLRAFIISDIPYLSIQVRDKVRRFITFLDAVYEAHGCIATTAAAPFKDLFVEPEDLKADNYQLFKKQSDSGTVETFEDDDLVVTHGFDKLVARKASMFVNDEEKFAFARALSRLTQMGTTDWIETPCDSFRGGLGEI